MIQVWGIEPMGLGPGRLWQDLRVRCNPNPNQGLYSYYIAVYPTCGLSDHRCMVSRRVTRYSFHIINLYWMVLLKGVPIFISASAISAYLHFFSISAYRLSANIFSADINIGISAITNIGVSAYRQKCHIGTPLVLLYHTEWICRLLFPLSLLEVQWCTSWCRLNDWLDGVYVCCFEVYCSLRG